jgi:hypothetical protein
MKVRDWERDILNRQRNIVFPDTMLNQTRFYRHIIQNKMDLNPIQRAGVLGIGSLSMFLGVSGLVETIVTLRDRGELLAGFMTGCLSLSAFFLGFLLIRRAVTAKSTRKPPSWWRKQQSRRRI